METLIYSKHQSMIFNVWYVVCVRHPRYNYMTITITYNHQVLCGRMSSKKIFIKIMIIIKPYSSIVHTWTCLAIAISVEFYESSNTGVQSQCNAVQGSEMYLITNKRQATHIWCPDQRNGIWFGVNGHNKDDYIWILKACCLLCIDI